MPPTSFDCVVSLLHNDPKILSEALDVLLRICRNIIEDPSNPKFRSISLGSSIVVNKLIPANGALECLFEMGFVEGSDCLQLPLDANTDRVHLIREELLKKRNEKLGKLQHKVVLDGSARTPSTSTPPQSSSISNEKLLSRPQAALQKLDGLHLNLRNKFLHKVLFFSKRVLQFENKRLQLEALRCIPLEEFHSRIEKSIRSTQEAYKKKKVLKEHDNYQELLLFNLILWFKTDFFSWVNSPVCPTCNEDKTKPKETRGSTTPGIDRIEVFECDKCQGEVLFPRYNDAQKLLTTRKGRCGEWADCFTLMCRAMGWDARLVLDETDHAWTEVFLELTKKWVHCDPCEGIVDAPLLYEAGWKKKLTYVMAYSCEEVQDITWRYSSQHKEVLKRRKLCKEEDLVQLITQIRDIHGQMLSPARRRYVVARSLMEVVEMLTEKQPTPDEMQGRISGSLAWRIARGEMSTSSSRHVPHVWTVTKLDGEVWTIGYSAAKDQYLRNGVEISSGWLSGVHEANNMQRKVENDWKMAYLARCEDADSGVVSWRFELNDEIQLDRVELIFRTTLYETGKIVVTLCSGDLCVRIPTGDAKFTTEAFSGCRSVVVTAKVSDGVGNVAWQHAQIFRQPLNDSTIPFELFLHLKSK